MARWHETTRFPLLLDALGKPEGDPAVRALAAELGGEPVAVTDRLIGEPALRSRRLLFSSGGAIILRDGEVAAVLLEIGPASPPGLTLSDWIVGADNDAMLDDLLNATGAPRHFAGMREPYLILDDGYARLDFEGEGGWNAPGNLRRIVVTHAKPGLACRPDDDGCPTCSELLVRGDGRDRGVDVDGTVEALSEALAAGLLTEDAHWVRLRDLQSLHASGLLDRVETQLTCRTCRRIICFTLIRGSAATFGYFVMNDAMRHRLEPIPPVEQWGDPARIAEDRDAMQYVDHAAGAWFLVEQRGVLYLQARYTYSAMVDDSVLVRLDDAEVDAYLVGGSEYLSELATRIQDSAPYSDRSPYRPRDLYRGPEAESYRAAVSAAVVNHTWIAGQRRTT
ncbi:hypothetical protein [Microbacterium sp. EST19A]|uniref:hypothetical protein n=1 Tax=Microbacterium sp. EST19A TaxID=2862681 RepID=UPI001CBAC6C1|nr:hypothetical protein [Microbacterium sp. EST19A]